MIRRLDTILLAQLKKAMDQKEEEKFDEAVAKLKKQGLDNFAENRAGHFHRPPSVLDGTGRTETRAVSRQRQSFLGKLDEAIKQYKDNDQEDNKRGNSHDSFRLPWLQNCAGNRGC